MIRECYVKLFTDGQNQAVRIPQEFQLPGNDVLVRKEGNQLIIEPRRSSGLADMPKSAETTSGTHPLTLGIPAGGVPACALLYLRKRM
jgi:antitoxin VapB